MRFKMEKRTGRKEKIYKKYSLLWIGMIALVVLDISVASVSAYFSDREEKRNRITVGDSNIEIVEEFEKPQYIAHKGGNAADDERGFVVALCAVWANSGEKY